MNIDKINAFEHMLIIIIQKYFKGKILDRLFVFISALGRTPFYIAAFFLIVLYSRYHAFYLLVLITISELVNGCIKLLIKRPRPFSTCAAIENKDRAETGSSFPSCHTQNTIIFWGYLMMHIHSPSFMVFSFTLIGLTIVSRLYLGLHYVSDILVGGLIGGCLLFCSTVIVF